jgi:catechol 2,3-dioxygenase-like lactoylglutathione lyase family enzyme
MRKDHFTRRDALQLAGLGGITLWAGGGLQAQAPNVLPLSTAGLEHYSITSSDPEATARFYAPIFDMQLFKERDPPARFYVKIGAAYIAFGGRAGAMPRIDHIAASVIDYDVEAIRAALEAAAIEMPPGRFAMIGDRDGLPLQLIAAPAGLAATVVPAYRAGNGPAALQAIGIEHVVLHVSDLERSAAHYRALLGPEVGRSRNLERVWFALADTRLGLEQASAPKIDHVCVRVAGFDRRRAAEKLRALGVPIEADSDERRLRFRDPAGIVTELTGA